MFLLLASIGDHNLSRILKRNKPAADNICSAKKYSYADDYDYIDNVNNADNVDELSNYCKQIFAKQELSGVPVAAMSTVWCLNC